MSHRRVWIILVGVVIVLLGIAVCLRTSAVSVVPRGVSTRFDDFAFTLLEARLEDDATLGRVCVITFDVQNQAKRVPFTFDPGRIILEDDAGNPHVGPIAWPKEGEGTTPAPVGVLPAGARSSFVFAYRLGEGGKPKILRMSFGPLGDFLEAIFYGRREFGIGAEAPDE
jgi:hypothetical protein